MFCENCGSQLSNGSKFCEKCGKPVIAGSGAAGFAKGKTAAKLKPTKKDLRIIFYVVAIILVLFVAKFPVRSLLVVLGDKYLNAKEYKTAYNCYMNASSLGSGYAAFKVGTFYNNLYFDYAENYDLNYNGPRLLVNGFLLDIDKSEFWFMKAAKRGDPRGIYYVCLSDSSIGLQDTDRIYLLEKAAKKSYAPALDWLGGCYEFGYYGVSINYDKALKYYLQALDCLDNPRYNYDGILEKSNLESTYYNIGKCYFSMGDYEKAIPFFSKDTAYGDKELQIGNCYYALDDYDNAFYWYEKDADLCCYRLGICYYEGKGVKTNKEKGIYWIRYAAEHRYGEEQELARKWCDAHGVWYRY